MRLGAITASEDDQNVFTIAAAKVGSKSFGADGTKYIFTEEALKSYAATWENGIITLNHDRVDDGRIIASWYDEETQLIMMTIRAENEDTAARIRAGEPTGVSIEAALTDIDDDNNVIAFDGTGVGIIFYPEQPACPLESGCGVRAKEVEDSDLSIDITKIEGGANMATDTEETILKTEFDAVVAKNEELVKELEVLKADDAIKAKDSEIETLRAKNTELTDEIDRRDSEIADGLVEEIKAWDEEFVPEEGMKLSTIKTIHASLKRASAKTEDVEASVPEEVEDEVIASNFTAPESGRQSGGLSIGGIIGGKWVGGK